MSKLSFSQRLISMFTTLDRSVAIVGDLAEESQIRGSGWFWLQLTRTAFALCFRSVRSAPLISLLLAPAGIVLSEILYWAALSASGMIGFLQGFDPSAMTWDQFLSQTSFWTWAIVFMTVSNFLVGLIFGRFASTKNMNGCVPTVALLVIYLAAWPFLAEFVFELPLALNIAGAVTAPVIYLAPLMVGGALGQRRTVGAA